MAKSDNVLAGRFHRLNYGSRDCRLAILLAALAAALLVADGIASASNGAVAQAIHRQTDITGDGNMATTYAALLAGLAAFESLRLATPTATAKSDALWLLLAIFLAGLAALELTGRTAMLPTPIVFAPLLGLPALLFLHSQLRFKCRPSLSMLAIGATLLMVAITEHIKETIVENPANYTFAGNDVPYRFNAQAMERLSTVTYLQEVAELAGVLLLVILLLNIRVERTRH